MASKKLNIHNPKKLNSTNHCLSGCIIIVEYLLTNDNEYIFTINANFHDEFTLSINRKIINEQIDITIVNNKEKNKIYFLKQSLSFCNNRNEFLDWIIKFAEGNSNQFFPF